MLFTESVALTYSALAPAIPFQSNSAHIANIQQLLSLFLLLLPLSTLSNSLLLSCKLPKVKSRAASA